MATVKPQYKIPQYNGKLDIKEAFISTEGWWTNLQLKIPYFKFIFKGTFSFHMSLILL